MVQGREPFASIERGVRRFPEVPPPIVHHCKVVQFAGLVRRIRVDGRQTKRRRTLTNVAEYPGLLLRVITPSMPTVPPALLGDGGKSKDGFLNLGQNGANTRPAADAQKAGQPQGTRGFSGLEGTEDAGGTVRNATEPLRPMVQELL